MKISKRSFGITIIGLLLGMYLISPTNAANATFSGPAEGPVNKESMPFKIVLDQQFAGNFHVDVSGAGLDYRISVNFDKSSNSQAFTILPTQVGEVRLIANPSGGPRIDRTLTYRVTNGIDPSPSPTPTTTTSPSASPTPTTSSGPEGGSGGSGGASGSGGGGGTGSGNQIEATTTVTSNGDTEEFGEVQYLSLPFVISYDPKIDLTLTFELPGGTRVDLATLYVPKGVTSGPAILSVSLPSPIDRYSDGELDLDIGFRLQSTNQEIETLLRPIQIRMWSRLNSDSVLLIENSSNPVALARLAAMRLDSALENGIFSFKDGTAAILTMKLSRFATPEMLARAKAGISLPKSRRDSLTRNRLIYWVNGNTPSVILDYKKQYAGKQAILELRQYTKFRIKFIELGKVEFDKEGNAWLMLKAPLKKQDFLRVVMNKSILMYHTIH